jgi:hypothetical protein
MSKFDDVPPPTKGFKRQHLKCRTCGRIMWYDYLPYSLSNPIMTTSCGHGSGMRDLGCDHITEDEARIEFDRQHKPEADPKDGALEAFEAMIRAEPIRGLIPEYVLKKLRSADPANPEFLDRMVDHDWQVFLKGWLAKGEAA